MFRTGLGDYFVDWAFWRDRLENLLELPFRIDLKRLMGEPLNVLQGLVQDKTSDHLDIAIEIHCADKSFERVRENGGALTSAARFFTSSHHQVGAQPDADGVNFQTLAGNEP